MFPDPETVKEALDEATDDVQHHAEVLASDQPWPLILEMARAFLALHQAISEPTDEMTKTVAKALWKAGSPMAGNKYPTHLAEAALAAVASVLLAERNEK